jgi:hypothetical protein
MRTFGCQPLLLGCALVVGAGCRFDSAGPRSLARDSTAPDGAVADGPVLDFAPTVVHVDLPPPDAPRDRGRLDKPPSPAQGETCLGYDAKFTAHQPPAWGKTLAWIKVDGGNLGWEWVMVGVKAPSTAPGWKGAATNTYCDGYGPCTWTFHDLKVPAAPGPYSFHLRTGAINDDPTKGQEISSCMP